MIESIITDYLQSNRRLVIPGLGAFLRKEGGEVVFVPFLNKDDGVLSGLVRQTYGSSAAEAEEIIEQYTDGVAQALAGRGSYFVTGFGSLQRDANGILFLDPDGYPQDPAAEQTGPVVSTAPVIEAIEVVEISREEVPVPEKPVEIERPTLVGEEIAAPKTLYDRLLEQQEQEKTKTSEPKRSIPVAPPIRETSPRPHAPASPRPHTTAPHPKTKTPAPVPRSAPQSAQTGTKRADLVLILAIVIAVIAIIAIVYAYTSVGGPTFNLE